MEISLSNWDPPIFSWTIAAVVPLPRAEFLQPQGSQSDLGNAECWTTGRVGFRRLEGDPGEATTVKSSPGDCEALLRVSEGVFIVRVQSWPPLPSHLEHFRAPDLWAGLSCPVLLCMFCVGSNLPSSWRSSKDRPGSNLRSPFTGLFSFSMPLCGGGGNLSLPLLWSLIIYPNLQSLLAPVTVPEGRTLEREYLDLKPALF